MNLDPQALVALRSVRPVGAFFAVDFGATGGGWQSLHMLQRDELSLRRRVAVARRVIARPAACVPGDVPLRVAASIDLLGTAARIVSPLLAACTLDGVSVQVLPQRLWLRPGGHPIGLTAASAVVVATAPEAARTMYRGLVQSVLAPLVALYRAGFGVSPRVLWGDVASALNGAAQVIDASGREQRIPVGQVVAELLCSPELSGTARSTSPKFVRNSCCLYYRIPGGGFCGDCVLMA